jgi:hypothetical protein
MDGIGVLLSRWGEKWDDMDGKGKAFVLVLGLGAIAYALNQIWSFIEKLVSLYISQNILISTIAFIPFKDLLLILFYTIITILLINRARSKAESKWSSLCGRLYGQIRKDHSGMVNMVWDTNKKQNKLLFRNELDQLIYDAERMLEDKKKR